MERITQVVLIILAGVSVALADGLIKKAAFDTQNFWVALKNPLMIIVLLLYVSQITLFAYVFVRKWDLSITGLIQILVYIAVVIFTGITFFHEKITPAHGAGMIFALIAVILMSL